MLEDVETGTALHPAHPDLMAAEKCIRERQPAYVSYVDWLRLNTLEVARGKAHGRPRVKFTCVADMLAALQKDLAS